MLYMSVQNGKSFDYTKHKETKITKPHSPHACLCYLCFFVLNCQLKTVKLLARHFYQVRTMLAVR